MKGIQTLSRRSRFALTISALLLLVGSSVAFAAEQKTFTAGYEFQVVDPAQPIIEISVNGTFIEHDIAINVNLSSYDGVKQLNGTYTVVVQLWNDTSNAYEPFQTLESNQTISLTPTPTTLDYIFTTDTPGTYNVAVEFTTTGVELA